MSLKKYNDKRNFESTNEPKGKIKKTTDKRFVIQYHVARAKHYDFRLEYNGVLLSFAIPKGLSLNPKDKRLAVMVEDHPLDYISFEGIIPKGNYGAGTVEIYDKGTYISLIPLKEGLKKGHFKIFLNGEKNQGEWDFIKIENNNWLAIKSEDEYCTKVKIKKNIKLPFKKISPQLATLKNQIPKGKNWIYEIKYDGYRIIAYSEKNKVKLLSRNNIEYTKKFDSISKSLKEIKEDSFVLDGEVVVFDKNGRSDFGLLQESIKYGTNGFHYVVFDLLALNGEDLRELPLYQRKEKLSRLLFNVPNNIIYSKHIEQGLESYNFAKKNNLEGIIAKNKNSKYQEKRNEDWIKIKCFNRQEFIIIGYKTSEKNQYISSLLLGYYENDKLIYIGKVGTGFNETTKKELHQQFQQYHKKFSPLFNKIKEDNITWLKPHFVAEIQYVELTKDNLLRNPSFIGLRKDKKAKDVKLEKE